MKVSGKQSSASVRPTAATRKRHTSSRWSSRNRWKGGSTAIQRASWLVREMAPLLPVEDRLDVVPVGIQYERRVVPRVVLRPLAGPAVIGAARRQRRRVPGLDLLVAGRGEGDVQGRHDRAARLDAEVLAPGSAERDVVIDHDLAVAERRER